MSTVVDKKKNIRTKLEAGRQSPYRTYKALVIGEVSFGRFLLYELVTFFFGPLPGAIGYLLRKKIYPLILKQAGTGMIIGRNVTIRHPGNISFGNNVVIDDNCVIDARGSGEKGLAIGDNVLINRNCMLLAKNGPIHIGENTSIGSNAVIVSMAGIEIGSSVLMAGGCYLSAGAYRFDDPNKPVIEQQTYTNGPITIDAGAWLGTRVTVLDNVRIGKNAVIGAAALVNKDIPDRVIAIGVPAQVVAAKTSDNA